MKSSSLTLLASLGALTLSACATTNTSVEAPDAAPVAVAAADTAAPERPAPRRRGGGHGKADFFNAYDTDGDGSVSAAEYKAARDAGYDARDMDGDDQVLVDEYVAEYEARLAQDLADMRDRQLKQAYVRFDVLDTDKDGILSRAEFQASGERMFGSLDTNKDGVVNEADTEETY